MKILKKIKKRIYKLSPTYRFLDKLNKKLDFLVENKKAEDKKVEDISRKVNSMFNTVQLDPKRLNSGERQVANC